MANIQKKHSKKCLGGKEEQMSDFAKAFLVIGVLGLFACLLLLGREDGLFQFWIALGIGCFIQGLFFFIILSFGAEIIRLLKKLNGLPFGGEISGKFITCHIFQCSECKTQITKEKVPLSDKERWPRKCQNCGVEFAKDEEANIIILEKEK